MSRSDSKNVILQRIRRALSDVNENRNTGHRLSGNEAGIDKAAGNEFTEGDAVGNRNSGKKAVRGEAGRHKAAGLHPASYPDQIERNYRTQSGMSGSELTALFAERVGEYRAEVKIVDRTKLTDSITSSLRSRQAKNLVIARGFQESVELGSEFLVLRDEPVQLTNNELDQCDAVLTTCCMGIAETGTIILNSGEGQGRRALTLIPDFHICVVPEDLIRGTVPEAFAGLDAMAGDNPAPITFISGPSATSDIELNRVEGVHGPRTLHVIITRKSDIEYES